MVEHNKQSVKRKYRERERQESVNAQKEKKGAEVVKINPSFCKMVLAIRINLHCNSIIMSS